MSQFVTEKSVFVNQNLESREALLRFVSDKAAEFGITDNADAVYDAFMAREAMGETGMTDGFAVPHAKSDDIKDAAVIVVKNAAPLEWPSFDEKPVDVAIALLVPGGEAGTTHIKLLSKTAVLLMRDEFKNLVHGTDDPATIASAINAGIDEE
ncbi:MAG TPA: fructose PTS transporter subunit IIA [Candidatus Olsenella excrementigallinarum]|nr:fructose PTS transporter subunit IIA [Candidatus Olsenella excrementigallinarum]